MEEKKNVENFGVDKPIDFVLETVKSVELEDMELVCIEAGKRDKETITLYEVLDMVWTHGQSTGGYVLTLEDEVPEFITIEHGHRSDFLSRYYYRRSEVLFTDGNPVFVSRMVDTDGNTRYNVYYKYKVINAKFAMIVRYDEDNFDDIDQSYLAIWVYGDCPKLVEVLRRLDDLLTP